jgi:hypothetical protein
MEVVGQEGRVLQVALVAADTPEFFLALTCPHRWLSSVVVAVHHRSHVVGPQLLRVVAEGPVPVAKGHLRWLLVGRAPQRRVVRLQHVQIWTAYLPQGRI